MQKKKTFTNIKKYVKELFIAPFFKLIETVIELIAPFIVRYIIDEGIFKDASDNVTGGDTSLIVNMSLLMVGIYILAFCSAMVCQYLAVRAQTNYAYDLRADIMDQYSLLSKKEIELFSKEKVITLTSNDTNNVSAAFGMFMRLFVRAPLMVIGSIVCAFIIDRTAGLIFVGVLLLAFFIVVSTMLYTTKKYQDVQKELDNMSTIGNDNLYGTRVIRAFSKENYEINKFKTKSNKYKKLSIGISFIESLNNPLSFACVNMGIVLILYFGAFQSSVLDLSTGNIISLIQYLNQALLAVVAIVKLVNVFSKGIASKRRIDYFFSLEGSVSNTPVVKDYPIKLGEPIIEYKNVAVTFGDNEFKSIDNINLEINKGETVGIIGGTGSGKSVIIKLLERFYNPSEGSIFFKGRDIRDFDIKELRSDIALVSQKSSLLKGTIKSNLLIAKADASDEEIIAALKKASADFVFAYKDGINHEVEEDGSNFSGGQKQRLNIARAILKEKEILILDDSTSALDYITDRNIRKNVKELEPDLTTIIISQRASSLINCDKIYVVDHGSIVSVGQHKDLLISSPLYKEIYETQVANL